MGASCLTDGKYIFPEKLSHYVGCHNVRLPDEFVNHIKTYKPINMLVNESNYYIDNNWWQQEQGFNTNVIKSFLASTDEEIKKSEKRKYFKG